VSNDGPLRRAIARAEALLPGRPAPRGIDPRWQAIICVGAFIESHPEAVCAFAVKWAKVRGIDLQMAISCCLIEHLLEHHFDVVFPIMQGEALKNARVAEHFCPNGPWRFGQAELPRNAARLRRLARDIQRQRDDRAQRRTNRRSSAKK